MVGGQAWIRIAALYLFLLLGGWMFGGWLLEYAVFDIRPANEPAVHRTIMFVAGLFVAASAMPFVPGAEIGFGLILMLGGQIAFLVYLCMVLALTLAYLAGRFLPGRLVIGFFEFFRLRRAAALVRRLEPLSREDRLTLLMQSAPRGAVRKSVRHRYVVLALLFNLPGNSLIGGGGGIAFVAGMSGVFSFAGFLAATLVAVAPVPLFLFLTG